ncbi:hypothetical protein MMC34_007860 [Xylographa carneopallida]|nr:hypothetical protein [Xylographa carneopallida]
MDTSTPASARDSSGTVPVAQDLKPPKSTIKRCGDWILWFFLDQWFIVILGILILVSSQVQVPVAQQFEKENVINYLCVSLIFFINGVTLPTRTLIDNLSRWREHLFIQLQSYFMASAVTFGVVSAAASNKDFMDPSLLVGMIVLGCLPTTIAFNVRMTRKAHGNEALTVVQSTIGNFLGPFLSPALINMYLSAGAWYTDSLPKNGGGYQEIYSRVLKQLGLTVFLPIFVGQLTLNLLPTLSHTLFTTYHLSKLGSLALLLIIWQTFDEAFSSGAFASVHGSNILFVVFISAALFAVWLAVCFVASIFWLPKADTVAVVFCVPSKTPAMGVPLASVMFVGLSTVDAAKLRIPMVVFQGVQVLLSSLLTVPLRGWVDRRKVASVEKGEGGAGQPAEA